MRDSSCSECDGEELASCTAFTSDSDDMLKTDGVDLQTVIPQLNDDAKAEVVTYRTIGEGCTR